MDVRELKPCPLPSSIVPYSDVNLRPLQSMKGQPCPTLPLLGFHAPGTVNTNPLCFSLRAGVAPFTAGVTTNTDLQDIRYWINGYAADTAAAAGAPKYWKESN